MFVLDNNESAARDEARILGAISGRIDTNDTGPTAADRGRELVDNAYDTRPGALGHVDVGAHRCWTAR